MLKMIARAVKMVAIFLLKFDFKIFEKKYPHTKTCMGEKK